MPLFFSVLLIVYLFISLVLYSLLLSLSDTVFVFVSGFLPLCLLYWVKQNRYENQQGAS